MTEKELLDQIDKSRQSILHETNAIEEALRQLYIKRTYRDDYDPTKEVGYREDGT